MLLFLLFSVGLGNESGDNSGASTPASEHEAPVIVGSASYLKETNVSLTEHPARKFVMDFLRVIVVDSLPLSVTSKQAPVSRNLLHIIITEILYKQLSDSRIIALSWFH